MRLSLRLFLTIFCISLAVSLPSRSPSQEAQQPPNAPPVVKSFVNEVVVPVVVRNSKGQAIPDLTKDSFQLFDDGKQQAISGFMVIQRAAEAAGPNSGSPNPTNNPATTAPPPPAPSGPRFIVFMFDDLNLNSGDLTQAQQAAIKVLDTSLSPSDTAAVMTTSGTNSGLTRDHNKLKQAIMDVRIKNIYHDSHECPNMDYYMADMIVNKNDSQALQAAAEETMTCAQITVPEMAAQIARQAAQRAVLLGDQNFRTNLGFLRLVISKMGPLPGQRIMILISPGFLTPTAEAMNLKSEILDMAARGNVVVNVLDARGLYTTGLDASQTGGGSPLSAGIQTQYRQASKLADSEVMQELADGTGGTIIQNSNDLAGGLGRLIAGPEYLYLLSFSIANMKPNGAYHKIKVKVNQPGLTIQARQGYFAPLPDKKKK
jgi:VWFA-related protein